MAGFGSVESYLGLLILLVKKWGFVSWLEGLAKNDEDVKLYDYSRDWLLLSSFSEERDWRCWSFSVC
jgi:hypothetical protein